MTKIYITQSASAQVRATLARLFGTNSEVLWESKLQDMGGRPQTGLVVADVEDGRIGDPFGDPTGFMDAYQSAKSTVIADPRIDAMYGIPGATDNNLPDYVNPWVERERFLYPFTRLVRFGAPGLYLPSDSDHGYMVDNTMRICREFSLSSLVHVHPRVLPELTVGGLAPCSDATLVRHYRQILAYSPFGIVYWLEGDAYWRRAATMNPATAPADMVKLIQRCQQIAWPDVDREQIHNLQLLKQAMTP